MARVVTIRTQYYKISFSDSGVIQWRKWPDDPKLHKLLVFWMDILIVFSIHHNFTPEYHRKRDTTTTKIPIKLTKRDILKFKKLLDEDIANFYEKQGNNC